LRWSVVPVAARSFGRGPIGCSIGGIDDNGNAKEFIMDFWEWWDELEKKGKIGVEEIK
jgi:hypothetical protein